MLPVSTFEVVAVMDNGSTQRFETRSLSDATKYMQDLPGALFKCIFADYADGGALTVVSRTY